MDDKNIEKKNITNSFMQNIYITADRNCKQEK